MKVALLADIHDNLPRLNEALLIAKKDKIKTAICLGDVGRPSTLEILAAKFEKVYLALGNMDFVLAHQPSMIPENVEYFGEEGGLVSLDGKKIYIVHYDFLARKVAETGKYDLVLYGHTHTPWEKRVNKTILLNPGEISGQFGQATFAIYDLGSMQATLYPLA